MNFRNIIMWGLIVLLSVGLFNLFQDPRGVRVQSDQIAFSEFLKEVDTGRVVQVEIKGNNIEGTLSDGSKFNTYSPNYPELVDKLNRQMKTLFSSAFSLYNQMLEEGVAKECARFVLPLATPTRLYMTGSVRSWVHYIELRSGHGTQKEHMDIANGCKDIFIREFPTVAEALEWD